MGDEERFQTILPLSRVAEQSELDASSSGVSSRVSQRDSAQVNSLLPAMVETLPAPMVVLDEQLRVVIANPAARQILGAEQGSILGYSAARFLSKVRLEEARVTLLSRAGKTTYRDTVVSSEPAREVELSVDLLSISEGDFLCLTLSDTTDADRERAEWRSTSEAAPPTAHLERAHHLEALGQLTGTLAHDFNNLLAVILGSLETAKRRLKREESPESDIERALTATERSIQATSQVLHYARKRSSETEALNPAGVILELRGLIDRAVGDGVELLLDTRETPRVRVAPAQLETALLNLVINARDALEGEGAIEILLDVRELTEAEAASYGLVEGEYVVISVKDDGAGMSEDVQAHAFEPFYTTKPEGFGTGLGLSSVLSTMRKLGGAVSVQSSPGRGTTVHLLFPAAAPASSSRDPGMFP